MPGIVEFNAWKPSGVLMDEPSGIEDAELVRRARDGDRAAFGGLVERYSRAAYSVAFSVTRSREDAEDVAQEAFLVALQRIDECRRPSRFAGWLMTIVRNRAKNLIRRESIRVMDIVPETAATDRPNPREQTETVRLRKLLTDAMETLSEVQREVVLLHDLEGWKHREIAERLDLPEGTVRSHLHFARKALRTTLAPLLDRESKDGNR